MKPSIKEIAAAADVGAAVNQSKIGRDVRLDQIGYVAELQKQHADALKTAVKVRMTGESIDRLRGEFFEGLLVTGTTSTTDPAALFRMYKRGELKESQFIACIKVNRDAALEHLSREQLADISEERPSSPSLRVSLIKGLVVNAAAALDGLAAAVRSR